MSNFERHPLASPTESTSPPIINLSTIPAIISPAARYRFSRCGSTPNSDAAAAPSDRNRVDIYADAGVNLQ
jgi:hypothetical protein